MRHRRFRPLATVLAAIQGVALCGASAYADPIRIATLDVDAGAQAYYAQDLGYFRDAGLDVRVEGFGNGAAMISAVASGAMDVGYANLFSLAQAHERDLPLVLLFPGSMYDGNHPATLLVVAPDSPIRTAKDLAGKTIAVNGIGTLTPLAAVAWLDRNGADGSSLHFVELGASASFAALAGHKVDAAIVTEPFYAANAATVRVLAPGLDGVARQFVSGGYFATRQWVAAHPREAAAIVGAIRRAAVWGNAHQHESAAILAKYTKMDPDLVARMTRTPYAEKIVPAEMQIEIDVAAKYHYLDHAFPIADILFAP